MNVRTRTLTTLLAAGSLLGTVTGGASAASTASTTSPASTAATTSPASKPTPTPNWQPEPVPVPSGNIFSLVPLTSHVIWGAGFELTRDATGVHFNTLVMSRDDRDGKGWQRVATPGDDVEGRANGMGAAGPDDVWVVGDSAQSSTPGAPVVAYHWDGHTWQTRSAPVPTNSLSAGLQSVSVVNEHDAWAVGWALFQNSPDDVEFGGLMEHWDGTAWRQVRLPVDMPTVGLDSVTATGPDDVWAVGTQQGTPLVLHFDGKAWSVVPNLPPVDGRGEFHTVVTTGPHDVWAAGDIGRTAAPLVEHFDGRQWTKVAAPGDGAVFAATATPDGVAFVGYNRITGAPYGQSYTRHGWTDLALPVQGRFDSPYSVAFFDKKLTVGGAYSGSDGTLHTVMLSGALPRS